MGFQIGRFGYGNCVEDSSLRGSSVQPEPSRIVHDGDRVTIEGWGNAEGGNGPNAFGSAILPHLIAQIQGLAENAEPVVPIWSDLHSTLRGMYTIESSEVAVDSITFGDYGNGYGQWFRYRVTARRVSSHNTVATESRFFGAKRNIHSSHTPANYDDRPWLAVPGLSASTPYAFEIQDGPVGGAFQVDSVTSETSGADDLIILHIETSVGGQNMTAISTTPIHKWYHSAAEIRFSSVPVIGTQTPLGIDTDEDIPGWSLTNGLVRISNPGSGASGRFCTFDVFNGTAWEEIDDFSLQTTSGNTIDKVHHVSIQKNTPVECVISLIMTHGSDFSDPNRTVVTARLRRGARHVEFEVQPSLADRFVLKPVTSTQISDKGFYTIRATDDSNGNRFLMFCANQSTVTTSPGAITMDTADESSSWALGAILNYLVSDPWDDEYVIVDSYVWAASETMYVVEP